jgi:hypothetical protein
MQKRTYLPPSQFPRWKDCPAVPVPTLTKEQFLIQYVLARAGTVEAGFSGDGAAETAVRTWDIIQKACRK